MINSSNLWRFMVMWEVALCRFEAELSHCAAETTPVRFSFTQNVLLNEKQKRSLLWKSVLISSNECNWSVNIKKTWSRSHILSMLCLKESAYRRRFVTGFISLRGLLPPPPQWLQTLHWSVTLLNETNEHEK